VTTEEIEANAEQAYIIELLLRRVPAREVGKPTIIRAVEWLRTFQTAAGWEPRDV